MIHAYRNPANNPLRAGTPVLMLLFLLLLTGSLMLYKERILFIDPCFILFSILNNHEFVISEHRYGAFITQIFPLIAGWLQSPIPVVMAVYSVSYYLFYSAVILLLLFKFRQYALAILMAFYFTLMSGDAYFWPSNEVHQGMAWMFLFFGQVLSAGTRNKKPVKYIILMMTSFLAIFSHFIVIIPLTFLWLYFIINKHLEHVQKKPIALLSAALFFIMFVKYILGSSGWYDGEKLKAVNSMDIHALTATFSSGQASTFVHYLLTNYWLVMVLFFLGCASLIKHRNYLSLGLTATTLVAYFILICLTFPDAYGRDLLFYFESQWMAFAVIAATPFVYDYLPKWKPRQIILILAVIFIIRIIYMIEPVRFFHQRYLALEEVVNTFAIGDHSKIAVKYHEDINQTYLMYWGFPLESLTLSMMKGIDPPVTIKVLGENQVLTNAKDTFLSSFHEINYKDLNPVYFKIDTNQPYRLITSEEFLLPKNK